MIRILGVVVVILMAIDAVRRSARELSAHVAGRAIQAGVCAGEREPGQAMIELRAQPCVHRRMALPAGSRKSESAVVG